MPRRQGQCEGPPDAERRSHDDGWLAVDTEWIVGDRTSSYLRPGDPVSSADDTYDGFDPQHASRGTASLIHKRTSNVRDDGRRLTSVHRGAVRGQALCDSERYVVIPIDAARPLGSLQHWASGRVVVQEIIKMLGDCFGTSTLPRKRLMLRDEASWIFVSHLQ